MEGEDRYEPIGVANKSAKWPICELRAEYDCQICGNKHVVIVRARGANMSATLAKSFMATVKADLINKFFQEHPNATAKDFEIDRVRAEEWITYEDGDQPEKDSIGVPWLLADVEVVIDRMNMGQKQTKEASSDKVLSPPDVLAKNALDELSFKDATADGMEAQFRKRLKMVLEREIQLTTELALLRNEKLKLEAMIKAAEQVERVANED